MDREKKGRCWFRESKKNGEESDWGKGIILEDRRVESSWELAEEVNGRD